MISRFLSVVLALALTPLAACDADSAPDRDGAVAPDRTRGGDAAMDAAPADASDAHRDGGRDGDAGDAAVRGGDAGSLCRSAPPAASFDLPRLPAATDADADAGPMTAEPPPTLTAGPLLGMITDHGAKLWLRSSARASSEVVVWRADDPADAHTFVGPTLDETTDFVGVVELRGLDARTRYGYRVALGTLGSDPDAVDPEGRFTTLPTAGAAAHIRFALGADITGGGDQPIFAQMAAAEPDFALLIGDQIYADNIDPDVASYTRKYAQNWRITQLRELMSEVPTMMIWDDHDIADDYSAGASPRYEPARIAYELYAQAHNPPPLRSGALYYTFEAADVGFFVLDVRSDRSADDSPDGPDKSMLGARQKADLLAWLRCSTHRIKIIVSPVAFSRWARTEDDSWNGFAHERDEILGFIASNAIDDVLLLTGDQHWSAVFRTLYDDYRFYEFLPTPLSKTRSVAPANEADDILARDDDNFVFGVVDIDTSKVPAELALTLCAEGKPCRPGEEPAPTSTLDLEGAAENVPFTIHLTTDDLGLPH